MKQVGMNEPCKLLFFAVGSLAICVKASGGQHLEVGGQHLPKHR